MSKARQNIYDLRYTHYIHDLEVKVKGCTQIRHLNALQRFWGQIYIPYPFRVSLSYLILTKLGMVYV